MLLIIGAIVSVLLLIAVMIYKLPSDAAAKRKKEKKVPLLVVEEKDWKEIATRWEKKNNVLLGGVEKAAMTEKKLQKEIEGLKLQAKELLDKMALEKSWREKEEGNLGKSKSHEKGLKEQIAQTEKDLEREHSMRLQIERELQDIKIKFDQMQEEKRQATVNAASLSTTVKALQVEVKDLKRVNEQLKQKREDVQWVAKSEYDELLRKFNEKNP